MQLPDTNPMPELNFSAGELVKATFGAIRDLGGAALSCLTNLPTRTLASHGDHFDTYVAQRGAEAFLSAQMDAERPQQATLPGFEG
jgi:hypothetical protein